LDLFLKTFLIDQPARLPAHRNTMKVGLPYRYDQPDIGLAGRQERHGQAGEDILTYQVNKLINLIAGVTVCCVITMLPISVLGRNLSFLRNMRTQAEIMFHMIGRVVHLLRRLPVRQEVFQ